MWFFHVGLPFHAAFRQHAIIAGCEIFVDFRIKSRVTFESIFVNVAENGNDTNRKNTKPIKQSEYEFFSK